MPATHGRIIGLDGLRAVSVAMVLFGHMAGTRYFLSADVLHSVGDLANLGVRVFFVISGYLITGLLLAELRRTGTISLRQFYFRRTLRIFPAFYVFVVVIAILNALGVIQLMRGDMVHALTYTTNYHYDRAWWLGHLWSLSVEEQYYLLWPAALLLLGERTGLRAAAAIVALSPLLRLAMLAFRPDSPAIGEAFPTVADTIATGALAAGWGQWLHAQPSFARFIRSRVFWLVPVAAFIFNIKSGGRISVGVLETAINVCIALCVVRCATVRTGAVSAMLNARPTVFVGQLSYSIYLWQQPFLNHHSTAALTAFPVNIVALTACALVSYLGVEKPCLALRDRLQHRFARGERATATADPSAAPI